MLRGGAHWFVSLLTKGMITSSASIGGRKMVRKRKKKTRPAAPKVPADPTLLGLDLAAWAGARSAKGGRRDALLGRVEVLRLSLNGRAIEARVRGNRPLPYRVQVERDGAQATARCTCSGESRAPCRHAVAAMETLRFPLQDAPASGGRRRRSAGRPGPGRGRIVRHAPAAPGIVIIGGTERTRTRDERIASARSEELATRRLQSRRGRARIEQIEGQGSPRYSVESNLEQEPQVVTLRGPDVERLSCTCDDFAANELHTCRHVERVKRWRRRQRKSERGRVPAGMLAVSWWPRAWIDRIPDPLSEIRLDRPAGQLPRALSRYFDSEGWLRPRPATENASSWARSACSSARRVARSRGWRWELDPAVVSRTRAAAAEEKIAARRRRASENRTVWNKVISRVTFCLHSYQDEGARFLVRTGRAFLADDMGLGKTVQAIVASLLLRLPSAFATSQLVW